jgi:hypothetical protein
VRQINNVHDAENARQPTGEEKQERPIGDAIEDLDDPEMHTRAPVRFAAEASVPGDIAPYSTKAKKHAGAPVTCRPVDGYA